MRVGLYMREWQMGAAGLHAGLGKLGHRADFRRHTVFTGLHDCEPFDAVFTVGWTGPAPIIRESYGRKSVPVLTMDAPWLGPYASEGLWRLSAGDSPGWLFPEAPQDRARKLRAVPRFTVRKPSADAPVLLCGQMPGDGAHHLESGDQIIAWAAETIADIRAQVDRPVIWRAHPAAPLEVPGADGVSDGPIAEALEGAYAVVTISSGAGLDALAAGVPVIATGSPPYAHLAGNLRALPQAKSPDLQEVQALFARLAYQHWTEEELSAGEGIADMLRLAAGKEIAFPAPKAPEPQPEKPNRDAPPPKTAKPRATSKRKARRAPKKGGAGGV